MEGTKVTTNSEMVVIENMINPEFIRASTKYPTNVSLKVNMDKNEYKIENKNNNSTSHSISTNKNEISPDKRKSNNTLNGSLNGNKTNPNKSKSKHKRRARFKEKGMIEYVNIESFKKYNADNVFTEPKEQITCKCLIF